jgi:GNAT superfamily N-acetyltransferase
MAIKGVSQPEYIEINADLRLRKYDGSFAFAYEWYQDEETVRLVDGEDAEPYNYDTLNKMYTYLDNMGELYFIEVRVNGMFQPIGDVTFCQDDMPIVIGDSMYRRKGIGKLVVNTLIMRAKELGYKYLCVREIYKYNVGSEALFESVGFKKNTTTENGYGYTLHL